jgi:hypothetical protein
MVKSKSSWSQIVKGGRPTNLSVATRNLRPEDPGAVMFGCTNNTIAECHSRQLFGMVLISLNHNAIISYVFTMLSLKNYAYGSSSEENNSYIPF